MAQKRDFDHARLIRRLQKEFNTNEHYPRTNFLLSQEEGVFLDQQADTLTKFAFLFKAEKKLFQLLNQENFVDAFSLTMHLVRDKAFQDALRQFDIDIHQPMQIAALRMCTKIKELVIEASKNDSVVDNGQVRDYIYMIQKVSKEVWIPNI